jgi:hypothetical protein
MKNKMGKQRPVDKPYMIFANDSGWEWRVLKCYQTPDKEEGNPYARWFCAVKSPFTFGSWEYGDTYVKDVKSEAVCVVPFIAEEVTV